MKELKGERICGIESEISGWLLNVKVLSSGTDSAMRLRHKNSTDIVLLMRRISAMEKAVR